MDAGLSLVTHFYDTFDVPVMTDPGVFPAGLTDYILVEDRLTAEIIPDGVHVHPLLIEKTLRCKGAGRVAFVTDSVLGAGSPPGIYDGLYEGVEVEVTLDNGVRRVPDGGLSGSAMTQLRSFQNAVFRWGQSIPDASMLCSATPARVLGLRHKGYLAVGMDADVVVLDADMERKTASLDEFTRAGYADLVPLFLAEAGASAESGVKILSSGEIERLEGFHQSL
jgi:N-acetylglucosamine-6-phosphate deacetylase